MEVLYLSRAEVEAVGLGMREIIEAVEAAFVEKGQGRAEMPPKPGIHTGPDAFIHAMPAYLPDMGAAGIKWISGYPSNLKRGLPYISGLLVLNDPETGFPIAIMDATWITAMRTGAATAVAAKYLAPPGAQTLGILACGVQGRSNLLALREVCPRLTKVLAYDISPANQEKYVVQMRRHTGLDVVGAPGPREAVVEADIVVTSGPILKEPNPVIEREWFKEGALGVALDYDSYWKPEALAAADKFCTDDLAQLNYYRSVGYFKRIPHVYADLGEIVTGAKPGRQHDRERCLAMNLGLAIEDMATARLIYERATKSALGTRLPL
jgi:ornithine cyclodeaminase/alanine dehydrogenase